MKTCSTFILYAGCENLTFTRIEFEKHLKQHREKAINENNDIDMETDEEFVLPDDDEKNCTTRDTNENQVKHNWIIDNSLLKARRHVICRCDWPECGKIFRSIDGLKIHKKCVHVRSKTYKCGWAQCKQSFVFKIQLERHVSIVHTKDKKYKCQWPECEYQTCYKQRLEAHTSTHTGEYKYKCEWPQCAFKTYLIELLKRHEKSTHTGERPYPCTQCDHKFASKRLLYQHLRVHNNTKPYKCNVDGCNKRYKKLHALKYHLLTHSKQFPPSIQFKCPDGDCGKLLNSLKALNTHIAISHKNTKNILKNQLKL